MSSTANRTNRVLGTLTSLTLIASVTIALTVDTPSRTAVTSTSISPSTSTTTTTVNTEPPPQTSSTVEIDQPNPFEDEFEIRKPYITLQKDKPVKKNPTYWLDNSLPTRAAAILPNPFTYGESSLIESGITESENGLSDFVINTTGEIKCPRNSNYLKRPEEGSQWTQFETCSVMTTDRGQFLVIARSAFLNYVDALTVDAIKIEIFVPRQLDNGSRRAVQVMNGYFQQSLCSGRRNIQVAKAKVGNEDVLVVTDSFGDFLATQTTVIAMNSSGMPVVVASYRINDNEGIEVGSTDQSLVLVNGRTGDPFDESWPEYTLTELIPNKNQWLERLHFSRSDGGPMMNEFRKSVRPFTFLEYDFRLYSDERSDSWCQEQS
jgi:hypothetical protein